MRSLPLLQLLCLVPVVTGTLYALLQVWAAHRFARREARVPERHPGSPDGAWPAVSVLKPLHGLEAGLEENLRSTCLQDYPGAFQVVLSVQRLDDAALPLARALERELGSERVAVVVEDAPPVANGKIQNLVGALRAARHALLVISDSDCRVPRDYLRAIVAPLADPRVGYACTLYRAHGARRWYEALELLTVNADLVPNFVFAAESGATSFCLGASTALRRETLAVVGGFEALADYLVEDFELGRRIEALGLRFALVPSFVDTRIDLDGPAAWWHHQVYWDQNNRAARPLGHFATVVVKAIPFALLFAALRGFDATGVAVAAGAIAVRCASAAEILRTALRGAEGMRALWLLPLRDVAGLVSWAVSLRRRTFVWRGVRLGLTRDGRIVPAGGSA